jgi:hypothetical protein
MQREWKYKQARSTSDGRFGPSLVLRACRIALSRLDGHRLADQFAQPGVLDARQRLNRGEPAAFAEMVFRR